MNEYLAFDCETGGVTLDTSLLTVFFGVYTDDFQLVNELYLFLKPDDGIYRVDAEALALNGIDLVKHNKKAIPYKQAKPLLYDFLQKNYEGNKLTPVGHGIQFDIDRVLLHLISQGSWESFVSYRKLCTSNAFQLLQKAGVIPKSVSGSLGSVVKHFGLNTDVTFHDARVDTMQTVLVLQELLKIVKR